MTKLSNIYSLKINNLIALIITQSRDLYKTAVINALAEIYSLIDLDIELDGTKRALKEYELTDKLKIKQFIEEVRNSSEEVRKGILKYSPKVGGNNNNNYYSKYIKYKNKYLNLKNN